MWLQWTIFLKVILQQVGVNLTRSSVDLTFLHKAESDYYFELSVLWKSLTNVSTIRLWTAPAPAKVALGESLRRSQQMQPERKTLRTLDRMKSNGEKVGAAAGRGDVHLLRSWLGIPSQHVKVSQWRSKEMQLVWKYIITEYTGHGWRSQWKHKNNNLRTLDIISMIK